MIERRFGESRFDNVGLESESSRVIQNQAGDFRIIQGNVFTLPIESMSNSCWARPSVRSAASHEMFMFSNSKSGTPRVDRKNGFINNVYRLEGIT